MPEKMRVYWSKIRPDEGIMAHWAELGHALLRLQFATDEFESGMHNLKDLQSIYRIHCQLANYHACVYELQERLLALVAAMTKTSKEDTKKMLLKTKNKETLLSALPQNTRDCVDPLRQAMRELSHDVGVRNTHTHESFIRLAVNEGPRWIDIEDLWWELEEDTGSLGEAFRLMSEQGSQLISEYRSRAERIHANIEAFLKTLLPYMSGVGV